MEGVLANGAAMSMRFNGFTRVVQVSVPARAWGMAWRGAGLGATGRTAQRALRDDCDVASRRVAMRGERVQRRGERVRRRVVKGSKISLCVSRAPQWLESEQTINHGSSCSCSPTLSEA